MGTIIPALVAVLAILMLIRVRTMMSQSRIDSATARRLVDGGALLLDVRSAAEFESGHLDGATNVPVGGVAEHFANSKDRARPIVVYCRSGLRSARAKSILDANGFEAVHNLGPMSAWDSA